MSLEHCTTDDEGVLDDPTNRDWSRWVSASRTRNWCKRNSLQDWLELHGEKAGFERDPEPDPRTDFREFIFAKGREFEAKVVELLRRRMTIFAIDGFEKPTMSHEACRQTFDAMVRGEECITQGVLWNPANRTYGATDLLVRSDVLRSLFPEALTLEEAREGAPGLGLGGCHYRVVDIKFTTLRLDRHWNASWQHLEYMAQAFVYNEALGRIQGHLSGASYLLGRSWTGPGQEEGTGCLDRLAPVPHDLRGKRGALAEIVEEAVEWLRRVREGGAEWNPLTGPTVPELRPNPSAADYPWQRATALIAEATADPILAWQVGWDGRERAAEAGVTRWTDPRFDSVAAGVNGSRGARLDLILDHNRRSDGPPVIPSRIEAERDTWYQPGPLEFYVDFETVSDVNDDFSSLPRRGGQAMIFMIGCGHMEAGEWRFECFVADALDPASEAEIVEGWLAHMESVRARVAPDAQEPLVFHWSPAESSGLTDGLKSARTRHPERSKLWTEPNWFDFLAKVVRAEPVLVRGAMGFGLKTFAESLNRFGLIETEWTDNITDGLGAMVGAWTAYRESSERRSAVAEHGVMQAITRYNEVDCRVMMEVIRYLRSRSPRPTVASRSHKRSSTYLPRCADA